MESDRTDTARANDDSAMIDSIPPAIDQQGRSGGDLARDVATDAELHAIEDPSNHERATKQDDIDNDQAYRSTRPRD